MSNTTFSRTKFTDEATAIVLKNIANEQFGVSELAAALNMSRSNLLRRIKKDTRLSASQFIRQVRLAKAMELLREDSLTVSEISYRVGFGSTSYFIKCFREQYGYPPGEAGKQTAETDTDTGPAVRPRWHYLLLPAAVLALAVGMAALLFTRPEAGSATLEKSIAVLPFKNESSDTLNLYFVNGLMESTLNNLQKISDLRVVSRTSSEKYRETRKGIPEIAEELNVSYVVEGSGQRVGNQVLLNIQLIEALNDRPLWAEQYNREVGDVFALQNEVAKKIAEAIEAVVTPAELKQIEKIPTENLVAYDYYLRAIDLLKTETREGLEKAIPLFEKAIENDGQFALAYSNIAISYFFLDMYQKQKHYTEQINHYADKALLYDPKSAESLIAKALYYLQTGEYELAVPHLEKALEYNPNSSAVVQMLGDIYSRVIPNTAKYLEYALKGIQLDVAANDSLTQSFIYLHLSNALIQNGFVEEALTYINKSLDYNPENDYGPLLKTFILYAQNRNMIQAQQSLIAEWEKDTTRLDILQEVAKFYYFREKYDSAFYYYEKFVVARAQNDLNIYPQEDVKIARVYQIKGRDAQAEELFKTYSEYCENDQSLYKSASLAVKFAYLGDYEKALEQLRVFATQDNYQYWIVLFQEMDPLLKPMQNNPEYRALIHKIKNRFWNNQQRLKKKLEGKGLI